MRKVRTHDPTSLNRSNSAGTAMAQDEGGGFSGILVPIGS
jgi:hypothetical protein